MVREAVKDDLHKLLGLYLFIYEDNIPNNSVHLDNTQKTIIEDNNHHLIVNEINGEIVSSCVCVVIPNLTRNVRPYAFIENMVTSEKHHGKGYASQCLDYARNIAIENNCYKMMLLTGTKEEKTLAFYKNAGYNSEDKKAFIQWLE